jgi:hypothetical protein
MCGFVELQSEFPSGISKENSLYNNCPIQGDCHITAQEVAALYSSRFSETGSKRNNLADTIVPAITWQQEISAMILILS